MSDWPSYPRPNLPTVTPHSTECLGGAMLRIAGSSTASSAASGANIATFYPWEVQAPLTVVKGFAMNGATAAGNTDVGIYDHEFNLIVSSGATAMSGTNAIQEFDITDTLINPGRYWLAHLTTSTGTYFLNGASVGDEQILSVVPLLAQTGLSALPSTATPTKNTAASPFIIVFGFSTSTVI